MNERPESDKRPDYKPSRGRPDELDAPGAPGWGPDRATENREGSRTERDAEDLRNIARPEKDANKVTTWQDALDGDVDRAPPDGAYPPDDYDMNRADGDDYGGRWISGAGQLLVVLALLGLLVPLFTVLFNSRGTGMQTTRTTRSAPPPERVRARVLDVLDGNTIRVQIEGRESIVRYIGVELPPTSDPFHDVINSVNERWVGGRFVELEADDADMDPEGRLLRYVWVDNAMVNAASLAAGLARSVTRSPNDRYSRQFTQLEQNAQNDGLGLWDTGGRGA